jgi:exopolysaccharide production protein ExoQ
MSPSLATILYVAAIAGLFWLDRDRDPKARLSPALWVSFIWMTAACSRGPSVVGFTGSQNLSALDATQEGSPADRAFYTILLAIGLVILVGRWRYIAGFIRANWPMVMFFGYCLVSIVWSDFPDVAIKRWFKAIGDVVMVLIVLTDRSPLAALKAILARMGYILLTLSVLFIKYYPEIGRSYGPWGGSADYVGVATSKNTLGILCLAFGVAAFWRLLIAYRNPGLKGRMRHMAAQVIVLLMVVWLLKTTNALTSTATLIMASVLLMIMTSRAGYRRPAIIHVLVASMLAVSIAVVFLQVSPGTLEALGRNSTLTDRTAIWAEALSLVRNPILGTGFESFWLGPRLEEIWARFWFMPHQAHNGYLEIYLNLGWVGIALLGVVIVTGYKTVFRAWRQNPTTGSIRLAFFFMGLIFNFTEAAFFRMQAPAWIFFMFGLVTVTPVVMRRRVPATQTVVTEPPTYKLAASQG